MTKGGKTRRVKRVLRELCARLGQHQWNGEKPPRCEVCDTVNNE